MLDALKKALGSKEAAKPTLEVKFSDEQMAAIQADIAAAVAVARAEFEDYKQTAEAMVAAAEEQVATLTAQLAEANEKLGAAAAAIVDSEAAKQAAEASALAAKLAVRKEKVVAAIGTARADALLTVTEGMDDAAFDAVLAALGAKADAEAADPLFNEVGVEAQADPAQVTNEESKEMKILREKYKTQGK